MRVIFTSPDSLFVDWLRRQRVSATYFQALILGDLPREEAELVFRHEVENHPYIPSTIRLGNPSIHALCYSFQDDRR
ncbi:hypothetical protein PGTUg99_030776 [Puccinia graminis f. sp. tritici]|uniref:Uncharacterized protein n=1 Tax=Puccinia graminis f. sp. tritici TaxID=56615 RepID=A0A5B0SEW1_PUCGR|nr:hypothetical protein PGTUg99_030776 [Puccinia graminis f. sp. tritici]